MWKIVAEELYTWNIHEMKLKKYMWIIHEIKPQGQYTKKSFLLKYDIYFAK